ncbi:MAG: NrfD/PsrC family molybdoenzyme membrane anchor subunit [Candidatus Binatia bacterium]
MRVPANVFSQDYRVAFKQQQVWGVAHALEFFLLGGGAGLYLFSTWFARFSLGQVIAVGLVFAAGVSLMIDLGKPGRLWRSFANFKKSWISRGALSVFVFLAAAVLAMGSRQLGVATSDANFALSCEIAASIFAIIAMLYPGFVLSSYASIPAWNSPMIPLLFLIYSWTTGWAFFGLVLLAAGSEKLGLFLGLGISLIALTILSLVIHLGALSRGSLAVRESFRELTRGSLAGKFIGGVLGIGLVVPLLLVLWVTIAAVMIPAAILLAALLVLLGGFFFRYCVLKAGVYPPLF